MEVYNLIVLLLNWVILIFLRLKSIQIKSTLKALAAGNKANLPRFGALKFWQHCLQPIISTTPFCSRICIFPQTDNNMCVSVLPKRKISIDITSILQLSNLPSRIFGQSTCVFRSANNQPVSIILAQFRWAQFFRKMRNFPNPAAKVLIWRAEPMPRLTYTEQNFQSEFLILSQFIIFVFQFPH